MSYWPQMVVERGVKGEAVERVARSRALVVVVNFMVVR